MIDITRKWNHKKEWWDYSPSEIEVQCAICYRRAVSLTYQIVEKQYHKKGKIFCPHCKGNVIPIDGINLIEIPKGQAPLSNGNSTEQANVEKANLQGEVGGLEKGN